MAIIKCTKCGRQISDLDKTCEYCGAEVPKRVYCPNCGTLAANDYEFCAHCGAKLIKEKAPVKKKSEKKLLKRFSSSFLCVALVYAVSTVIANNFFDFRMAANEKHIDSQMESMEEFIETQQQYEPGSLSETSYSSDYWDIEFETDENWTFFSKEFLDEMGRGAKQTVLSTINAELKDVNVPSELALKYKETIYAAFDMHPKS